MLYAILCYDSEAEVGAMSREEDDAMMARLVRVERKLADDGRLGPVARLTPTTAATTVRKARDAHVMDGPYAETKEQLLGFYIVDHPSLDGAIATARALAEAGGRAMGAYEIRPIAVFEPGTLAETARRVR